MTCFLLRDYNMLPKKELHRSLQVSTAEKLLLVECFPSDVNLPRVLQRTAEHAQQTAPIRTREANVAGFKSCLITTSSQMPRKNAIQYEIKPYSILNTSQHNKNNRNNNHNDIHNHNNNNNKYSHTNHNTNNNNDTKNTNNPKRTQ